MDEKRKKENSIELTRRISIQNTMKHRGSMEKKENLSFLLSQNVGMFEKMVVQARRKSSSSNEENLIADTQLGTSLVNDVQSPTEINNLKGESRKSVFKALDAIIENIQENGREVSGSSPSKWLLMYRNSSSTEPLIVNTTNDNKSNNTTMKSIELASSISSMNQNTQTSHESESKISVLSVLQRKSLESYTLSDYINTTTMTMRRSKCTACLEKWRKPLPVPRTPTLQRRKANSSLFMNKIYDKKTQVLTNLISDIVAKKQVSIQLENATVV